MNDWIGETFTSDAGWTHLETLVDVGNRMAGQAGERDGLEATRDALDAVGARDARIDDFEIQGWVRGESEIRAGDTAQDAIALPRSPAGEETAELLDLGYGLPEDFERADVEGKLVMVRSDVPEYYDRFIHRTEKYYYAVEGGAAGFLFRNHVPGQLPPTGSVGNDDEPIGAIPAVGVSKEVGARLARRFDGDDISLSVDCETPQAESGNVHAELGPDTDEEVLLTSHVDAHDIAEGAMDNGAGTALVVEAAKALAAREDELDTKVHVVCYGAEEVGLVGSAYEAERVDFDRIKAVVNNDGVVRGRDLQAFTHGFDDLGDAVGRVADRLDHPIDAIPRQQPHSDHWPFVTWGVPGAMVMSDTGERGRGWGHTAADTLDKVDPRTLREQAILVTELVVELADESTTVARQEPADIAAALEAEDKAEGMKVIGSWPYDDR
jgi:Zn-dependent M28 family amino/carboxypeptidase